MLTIIKTERAVFTIEKRENGKPTSLGIRGDWVMITVERYQELLRKEEELKTQQAECERVLQSCYERVRKIGDFSNRALGVVKEYRKKREKEKLEKCQQ